MGVIAVLQWFYVNRYFFCEDMRQKRLSHFHILMFLDVRTYGRGVTRNVAFWDGPNKT